MATQLAEEIRSGSLNSAPVTSSSSNGGAGGAGRATKQAGGVAGAEADSGGGASSDGPVNLPSRVVSTPGANGPSRQDEVAVASAVSVASGRAAEAVDAGNDRLNESIGIGEFARDGDFGSGDGELMLITQVRLLLKFCVLILRCSPPYLYSVTLQF